MIDLVEGEQLRLFQRTEILQRLVHGLHLVAPVVAGRIEDVQQEVGFLHLFEGGLEGRHQVGRKLLDEADGIGEQHLAAIGQPNESRGRIERDKQRVLHLDLRFGQRVQQR